MTKTLKVYKDGAVVASKDGSGKTSVTVSGLEANTSYPAGTFKVAWEEDGRESSKVDVPAFQTKPILVTGLSFVPDTKTISNGTTDSVEANIAPSTATDKSLAYTSDNPDVVSVDESSGAITAKSVGTAVITAKSKDGSDKSATITVTVE